MAIRKRKPTSPGRRFQSVSDFADDHDRQAREVAHHSRPSTGGRNSYGRKTARHRGGGHKRRYRIIDFKREKDGVPAKVAVDRVRPEPQRAHRAVALPRRREALHPRPAGLKVGDMLQSGHGLGDPRRQRAAAALHPGRYDGAQRRVEAGCRRQDRPRRRRRDPAHREGRRVRDAAPAVHRDAPGPDRLPGHGRLGRQRRGALISIGKAGRNRWKGVRPQTRGVAMNPVDHPLGGGEGKSSGGRPPVSPWGKPEGRTRKKGKASDQLIVRRRRTRGSRR